MLKENEFLIPPGMLLRIMEAKRLMQANYEKLSGLTCCDEDKTLLNILKSDENRNFTALYSLYEDLFGDVPEMPNNIISTIDCFFPGIKSCVLSELNLYITFSNILSVCPESEINDTFRRILICDNRHAISLNYILAKNFTPN